jgi:hypothetical protein
MTNLCSDVLPHSIGRVKLELGATEPYNRDVIVVGEDDRCSGTTYRSAALGPADQKFGGIIEILAEHLLTIAREELLGSFFGPIPSLTDDLFGEHEGFFRRIPKLRGVIVELGPGEEYLGVSFGSRLEGIVCTLGSAGSEGES